MRRVLVFDVDGVVVDPGPGRGRLVEALSGCDEEELALLRSFRVFEHDGELAAVALAWREAGRPLLVEGRLQGLVAGPSLEAELERRYLEERAWEREPLLVSGSLLAGLGADFELVVVTGRSRAELQPIEERLELRFSRSTTREVLPRTDPEALLRLLHPAAEEAVVVGSGPAWRRLVDQARYYTRVPLHHVEPEQPQAFLEALRLEPWECAALVRAWGGR